MDVQAILNVGFYRMHSLGDKTDKVHWPRVTASVQKSLTMHAV